MTSVTTDVACKTLLGAKATIPCEGQRAQTATTKRILLPAIDACQGSIFSALQQREETGQRLGRRNARTTCARRLDQLKCGIGYFFGTR